MECRPEVQFSSVAQSCPTLCNPMDCSMPGFPVHHQLPTACSNSCPSSWWCHATLSSSVIPFSSCLQSLPASNQKWLKYNCWRGKLWLCCTMNAYQRFSSSDNLYGVIQFDVKRFKFFFKTDFIHRTVIRIIWSAVHEPGSICIAVRLVSTPTE